MTRDEIRSRLALLLCSRDVNSEGDSVCAHATPAGELVFAISMTLAESGKSVLPLLEALRDLAWHSIIPLAAAHHHHCACAAMHEEMIAQMAACSPVFRTGNACIACPCGPLDASGLMRVLDRLLLSIAADPPAIVRLYRGGYTGTNADLDQFFQLLRSELDSLRVALQVEQSETAGYPDRVRSNAPSCS